MSILPPYAQRMLQQAREEGHWYCGQAEAAALGFEVLALHPDCAEAVALIYELFGDEWFIYDMRVALQQQIEEWDDRPYQHRRRLALSFRFVSRWEGWLQAHEAAYSDVTNGPADVRDLIHEGQMQLLSAYCLGEEECAGFAWPLFAKAFNQTTNPRAALLAVGKQYAELGFFADAVEVLAELCGRFDDAAARRLLAEVKWWRDNAHRLPWLPPLGDGTRYKRMMAVIDPNAPTEGDVIQFFRRQAQEPLIGQWQATLPPSLADLVDSALPALGEAEPGLLCVDWSFLDADDGQPRDPPEWATQLARRMQRHSPELAAEILHRHRWSRPIAPPLTPKRHNPNEQVLDPAELPTFFVESVEDLELPDWEDLEGPPPDEESGE